MAMLKAFGKWFMANWERSLFVTIGLILLGGSLTLIYRERVTDAAAVFGLGFLSFIYANLSRFKRFKGLGFEAELWEDKQKEAADLIERLRDVVSIYTREVILGKVKAGRWGSGADWDERWKLYDNLVAQHTVLGQKIDFSDVKKEMDDYFLFDMTVPEIGKIRELANSGKALVRKKIEKEFGSPIRDTEGYNQRLAQLREMPEELKDPFEISTKSDLAGHALALLSATKEQLKRNFDVEIDVDSTVVEQLEAISKLYQSRPVQVTSELIAWANRKK